MTEGGKRCGCGSGCETFGECMRRKSIRIAYCQSAAGRDFTRQRKWDTELEAYRSARRQGVQPAGTTMNKIQRAMEISEKTGQAYDASAGVQPMEG